MKPGILTMILLVTLLSSCASNVFKLEKNESGTAELSGIPYNLPKTVIEVELKLAEKATESEQGLKITTTTKHVPDESALYVLDPQTSNWFITNNHNLVLKDGMLKSIDTIDRGETGSVIESASQSLINFTKARTYTAEGDQEIPFLEFKNAPTNAELEAMSSMLMTSSVKFSFSQQAETQTRIIPATNRLLYLEVGHSSLPDRSPAEYRNIDVIINTQDFSNIKKQCESSQSDNVLPQLKFNFPEFKKRQPQITSNDKQNTDSFRPSEHTSQNILPRAAGLYTRTLKDFNISSRLYADLYQLRNIRAEKMHQQINAMRDDLFELFSQQKQFKQRASAQCKEQQEIKAQNSQYKDQIEKLSILSLYTESRISNEQILQRLSYLNQQLGQLGEKQKKCKDARIKLQDTIKNVETRCSQIAHSITQINRVINWQPKDNFLVGRSDETVPVTSNNAVLVPLTRAGIGETTNNIRFDNGILTSYKKQSPASAKVLADSMVKASSTIYEGVVDIVQIPAKALGFQLEELEAKQAVTDSQIILNNKEDRLKGKRFEIQNTLLDAQLEAVIADPGAHMNLLDNRGLEDIDEEEISDDELKETKPDDGSSASDNPAVISAKQPTTNTENNHD